VESCPSFLLLKPPSFFPESSLGGSPLLRAILARSDFFHGLFFFRSTSSTQTRSMLTGFSRRFFSFFGLSVPRLFQILSSFLKSQSPLFFFMKNSTFFSLLSLYYPPTHVLSSPFSAKVSPFFFISPFLRSFLS